MAAPADSASSLQESIRRKLSAGKEEGANKQISLMVNERTLQIADAIEEYVNAASDVLLNDHLINIEEIASGTKWDLYFCPAKK